MIIQLIQSLLPSTGLVFVFSTGNLVFSRMNLKPAVLKNFVFDWALCFRPCEVSRFQNLAGLESPIKHTLNFIEFFLIFFNFAAILNHKDADVSINDG